MQTAEDRIRLQFRAHRRTSWTHERGINALYLALAKQWKRPVHEIKRIIRGPGWDPVAAEQRYLQRLKGQEVARKHLGQVRALMDVGRVDEARELFKQLGFGRRVR